MAPIWLLVCYIWKMTSGHFLGLQSREGIIVWKEGFPGEKSSPKTGVRVSAIRKRSSSVPIVVCDCQFS